MTALLSAETMREMIRFWAMDSKSAGTGYATLNVVSQPQVFPMKIEDLCTLMPSVYEQLGVDMLEAECGLEINGLDAARFLVRLEMGPLAVKEYQYVYLLEDEMWTLTFAVDATQWSEYESIFAKAANSFRVD